jgi:uncharacterized membrane protein YdfJ with MMPL/SSD domain
MCCKGRDDPLSGKPGCMIHRAAKDLESWFNTTKGYKNTKTGVVTTYNNFFVPNTKVAFGLDYYDLMTYGSRITNMSHVNTKSITHLVNATAVNGTAVPIDVTIDLSLQVGFSSNPFSDQAQQLLSQNNKYTFMAIGYNKTNNKKGNLFATDLLDAAKRLNSKYKTIRSTPTGTQVFGVDLVDVVKVDILHMDVISVPLGLLILCTVLRAPRLVVIPFLNIFASLFGSYMIMLPVSQSITVVSFAPIIMEALVIALSIDYACFILGRFIEECVVAKRSVKQSIKNTLATAGHTVLVSGGTLTACFVGIAGFPLQLIKTIGIGAVVAVVFTIATALTLGPSLILACPGYFGFKTCLCGGKPDESTDSEEKFARESNIDGSGSAHAEAPPGLVDRLWEDLAALNVGKSKWGFKAPAVIVAVVVAFTIPFAANATSWSPSLDTKLSVPRGSPATAAFNSLSTAFGAGSTMPYSLLIESDKDSVFSKEFYDTTKDILAQLQKDVTNFPEKTNSYFSGDDVNGRPLFDTYAKFNDSRSCPLPLDYLNYTIKYSVKYHKNPHQLKSPILPPAIPGKFEPNVTREEICDAFEAGTKGVKDLQACSEEAITAGLLSLEKVMQRKIVTQIENNEEMLNKTLHHACEKYSIPVKDCPTLDLILAGVNSSFAFIEGLKLPSGSAQVSQFCENMRFISTVDADPEPKVAFVNIVLKIDPTTMDGEEALVRSVGRMLVRRSNWCRIGGAVSFFSLTPFPSPPLPLPLSSSPPCFSPGHNWYSSMLTNLTALEKKHTGYHLFLAKGASNMIDGVEETYKLFPIIIAVTVAVVFVLVGGAFQSVVVPLRAIITILIAIGWVYGLAVLIFVKDGLKNSFVEGLRGTGEIAWFGPVVCFSVLVGLSLDYDIFLLERVHEYRYMGYSDRASVYWALKSQGSIITAAGGIMVIAFAILLISKVDQLNEIAMLLVFGVLWFTFVNIPLLVPSMMTLISYFGVCNWWPSKPPPVLYGVDDDPRTIYQTIEAQRNSDSGLDEKLLSTSDVP